MTDDIRNDSQELPLSSKPKLTRNRSSAQTSQAMAAVDRSLGNVSREGLSHGEGRAPRVSMSGADLALSLDPKYTSNPDYYYRWFYEGDSGAKIQRALAAYYDFVCDENGATISRASGSRQFKLMALHKKYRAEDDALKRSKHNAMMGKQEKESLGISGLDDYSEMSSKESHSAY